MDPLVIKIAGRVVMTFEDVTITVGGGPPPGNDQWPGGVIDFGLTIDFSKVWNFS